MQINKMSASAEDTYSLFIYASAKRAKLSQVQ